MLKSKIVRALAAAIVAGAVVPATASAYRYPVRAGYVSWSNCVTAVKYYYNISGSTLNCKRQHGGRLVFVKRGVRPVDVWSSYDGKRWWVNVVMRR